MLQAMGVSRPDLPAEPASVQSHEESRNHSSALVRRPLRTLAYVDISVKRKAAQAEQGPENSALCTTLELYNTTTRSAISESKGPNSFNSSLLPYHSPFLFLILFHHFLAQHERPETTLAILESVLAKATCWALQSTIQALEKKRFRGSKRIGFCFVPLDPRDSSGQRERDTQDTRFTVASGFCLQSIWCVESTERGSQPVRLL